MFRQEEPEVNVEQILERLRSFLGRFRLVGGGGGLLIIVVGILLVIAVIWASTGVFSVQPGEQAALRLFGKFDNIQEPGLHWFWPSPIGTRAIEAVEEVRRLEIGLRGDTRFPEESLMITGDENIVDVQLLVQYNIKDIEQFLFRIADPDGAVLKSATETSLRQVVGQRDIDDVLILRGREDVQAETKLLLQQLLDDYQSGINVTSLKLQSVLPPPQVQPAFDDVNVAREEKDQIINLAQAYEADILPKAQGDAKRLTEAAEAFKQERINIATGQANAFLAVLQEYRKAPEVTRQRLYLEAMEEILPGVTKFIVATDVGGNLLQFLPLTGASSVPIQQGGTGP